MARKTENGFPTNTTLEKAVVQALKNLGGKAEVNTINDEVISILQLPEEIVTLEDESGLGTKLSYRLRWARTNLKTKGIINSEKRGIWELNG